MTTNSKIEWTDHTFNPWEGCQKVGPGCDHCYAETRNARFNGGTPINWGPGAPRRRTSEANWKLPLRWNAQHDAFFAKHGRRQRVFCASLADVFDNAVEREWRDDLAILILSTPQLDWLLLTKRIGNAGAMLGEMFLDGAPDNIWLGATVVNQQEADRDIPKLLQVPARVRFLSMEPLLGPADLTRIPMRDTCASECCGEWRLDSLKGASYCGAVERDPRDEMDEAESRIDWVIVGGESGPGARPMHPDWARSLRDQCNAAGVPFFFKQWGDWWEDDETGDHWVIDTNSIEAHERFDSKTDRLIAADGRVFSSIDSLPDDTPCRHVTRLGKNAAGRQLDGRTWDEVPR